MKQTSRCSRCFQPSSFSLQPCFTPARRLIASTATPTARTSAGWIGLATRNNGAVIGEYVCSGYIYSANVGWINLGSGSPANQIHYQNNSATDFGVNKDGLGNLRGYA